MIIYSCDCCGKDYTSDQIFSQDEKNPFLVKLEPCNLDDTPLKQFQRQYLLCQPCYSKFRDYIKNHEKTQAKR